MDFSGMRSRATSVISSANAKTKLHLTQPKSWKLPKQHSSIAPTGVWTNSDQDPVPLEKRTWTSTTFMTYWFSDLVTVSGWATASSILTTGLSATDAILITLLAGICNAVPTVLNGAIGADLHVPFPVAIRASYGYWLSYFCVISRAVLAMFWYGVQSAGGGQCVSAVSLHIDTNTKHNIEQNSDVDCYLAQLPTYTQHPSSIYWYYQPGDGLLFRLLAHTDAAFTHTYAQTAAYIQPQSSADHADGTKHGHLDLGEGW